MAQTPKLHIERIDYHRNGVGGAGFHVVTFHARVDGADRNMVGICFFDYSEEGYANAGNPRVAVLDRDLLAQGDVGFGTNSWRGDHFSAQLLEAVQAWSDLPFAEKYPELAR